ncbi:MAG: hypothetical protein IPJ23_07680 [Ignavibacteriales bacterium]|nr:hypothetical protein [Ignavibacteriales bacterium]
MKLRDRCKLLCVASALIFLLGIVCGIGGVIDLINNTDILVGINISSIVLVLFTIILIFLSAATIITAIGVYEQNEKFILVGMALTTVFIFYSILKGYVLFGNSISEAAIINIIAGGIIISLLMLGKRTLDKTQRGV